MQSFFVDRHVRVLHHLHVFSICRLDVLSNEIYLVPYQYGNITSNIHVYVTKPARCFATKVSACR